MSRFRLVAGAFLVLGVPVLGSLTAVGCGSAPAALTRPDANPPDVSLALSGTLAPTGRVVSIGRALIVLDGVSVATRMTCGEIDFFFICVQLKLSATAG